MTKIKRLPKSVISKIAAGEVIERPCYVVKELIDNAIDAKATQIDIEIVDSGLTLISVTDNGVGMGETDLVLSIEPHTTSKIRSTDDLNTVKTLGFRGEALSSIASISTITIVSKRKNDDVGKKLTFNNGQVSIRSIGAPTGTHVKVQDLFSSVPTRKKFLKSQRTEFKHIIEIVSDFVLSNSTIGFTLSHNGKNTIAIYPNQSFLERINNLYGESYADNLISFSTTTTYLQISGWIGHPQISFATNSKLLVFVNGRKVSNTLLFAAIKEAFENLLEPAMYPAGIIYFKVPQQIVDVNIHPRKEDVRFSTPELIYQSAKESIKDVLTNNNLTFGNISWKKSEVGSHAGTLLKEELFAKEILGNSEIIQIKKLYLVTETANGICFYDQHAVHEAILFRKLKQSFIKKRHESESVPLDSPILLKLSLADREILWDNSQLLNTVGYFFDDFGDGTPIMTMVPQLLHDRNHEELITEMIESLSSSKPIKDIDHKSYRMLSYLACRSAIKGGQVLDENERRDLLAQLTNEDFVYTCPHGRPVKFEVSINQLHKSFKRR
jgi:DNA mismatch repair protein MutL